MGYNVKAKGNSAIALGNLSTATGDHAVALGKSANAEGEHSFAVGLGANALGDGSRAFGFGCRSLGANATAIGYSNKADGDESFAIGNDTEADGLNATSMGKITEANGDYSTSTGFNTRANGDISFAMGHGTRPATYASVALGQYNVGTGGSTATWVTSEPVLEVGIGLTSLTRENALTVLKNGTVSFKDYTFPNMDGTNNQTLITDGSGNLSWTSLDNSATNELISSVNLTGNILSITDIGNTFNVDIATIAPHSIEDNDADTKIEFNNISDKILFTTDGVTIAKMETDSMFIDGNLQVRSSGQSRLFLGDTFVQRASSSDFKISNQVNNTDDILINNQGQVGIANDNPQEVLDVYAENDFDGIRIKGSVTNDQVELKLDNNSPGGREYVLRSTGNNAGQGGGKFLIRDDATSQTRLSIDATGNVGISTVNPDEKLHVNGAVKINDLSGSGTVNVWVDANGKLLRGDNNVSHTNYINYTDFVGGGGNAILQHPLDGAYMTLGTGSMYATLGNIPDGATITSVKVYYYDDETGAGEDIDFGINYSDGFSGLLQVHSIGVSSNGGNTRNSSTFSSVGFTLDRTTYDYAFVASSSDWGTALKIFSVEITYTL